MFKKFLRLSTLAMLSALLLLPITPILAAPANPDSIALHSIRVYQNIFEDNDVLFMASYEVEYSPEPSEPAEDTFQLAVYDAAGTTLIRSRVLNEYQYNVHSVYFTAAQATADLTWDSEYKVRVMGQPAFFPMTEGVTMNTITLSSYHWIEGTMTESRELLRLRCLYLAEILEVEWTPLELIHATIERDTLNGTLGRATFLAAVTGLDSVIPELFQVAIGVTVTEQQAMTAALEEELTVESQLGAAIKASFDGFGDFLGVSGGTVAWMWIMLFMVVVASIVFLNSGNTTIALVLTIPIALIGVWAGAIPMAVLFTVGAIIVVYMGYHVFLRGM